MVNQNRQRVEQNHLIAVTLVDGNRASIFIKRPSGDGEHPTIIDISTWIAGGVSEGEALEQIAELVAIGVRSANLKKD